jgi:hypothetical protein
VALLRQDGSALEQPLLETHGNPFEALTNMIAQSTPVRITVLLERLITTAAAPIHPSSFRLHPYHGGQSPQRSHVPLERQRAPPELPQTSCCTGRKKPVVKNCRKLSRVELVSIASLRLPCKREDETWRTNRKPQV